jgi:murein DD-endopeptidase MepM/ murein hydrolase activator NlpD
VLSAALLGLLLLAGPLLRQGDSGEAAGSPEPPRPAIVIAPIGPLLAERTRFTAGFGEPRSLRLHAGVDFSTNQRTGMPVLAPAGGWLSRIAADYTGYGLQLMLTDSLGRRHLFAHLKAFRADVEAELERLRQESGLYPQLLHPHPGAFPVRGGEVIAWSGDTGIGSAHLHYELRSTDEDRCWNPLRHGMALPDNLPPAIEGLALVPLMVGSRVEGGLFPHRLAPLQSGSGRYQAPDTLDCQGAVGLALQVIDRLPGTGGRLPVWRVALVEEGDTLFNIRLDSFPLDHNPQSGRLFHRWLKWESGQHHMRLWGDGGGLGLWDQAAGDGVLRPDPTRPLRHLEILVWDAAENPARLNLLLRQRPGRPLDPVFSAGRAGGQAGEKEKAAWSLFPLPDGLHLRLAPLPASAAARCPVLVAGADTLRAWGQWRARGWEWALDKGEEARALAHGQLEVGDRRDLPTLALRGLRLEPDRAVRWRHPDGGLGIVADSATVEQSTLLLVNGWRDARRPFTLDPPHLQLERPLTLELELEAWPADDWAELALFQAGAKGQPASLVAGGGGRERNLFRTTVGRTGDYVLHADRSGPAVTLHKPGTKSGRHPTRPTLVWTIGDDPSGIANVELREGGRRHYPHYEPDTRRVEFRPDRPWDPGEHEVELRVRDRSGNETILSSTIRIAKP